MTGALVAALVRSRATRDLLGTGRWVVRETPEQALADARQVAAATRGHVGALWYVSPMWAVCLVDKPSTFDLPSPQRARTSAPKGGS